jgi:hypothetical protein
MDIDVRRRSFLRTTGVTSAAVLVGGLAGCSSEEEPSDADDGNGDSDGDTTVDEVPGGGDFFFEFDDTDGTLSITYLGGRYIPADQLEIAGENLGGASGPWIDFPGAEATATVDGVSSLGSQDSVTLGAAEGQGAVGSDYTVELVFVSDDGTRTVIASDTGPDA